jgi:Flp pilus assembly protein TadD
MDDETTVGAPTWFISSTPFVRWYQAISPLFGSQSMNTLKRPDATTGRFLQSFSLRTMLIAGVTASTAFAAVCGGAWWILSRRQAASGSESITAATTLPKSVTNVSLPPATPNVSAPTNRSGSESPPGQVVQVADNQPNGIYAPTPKTNSNAVSVLGKDGVVDRLASPVAFPKGMLAFLRGLDLLGAFHPIKAIASFSEAIESDNENADFYTARGAAYVVAQKMQAGIPDLERATQLNPEKVLASRMTRLAYLMLGDQLKASKFYGHGSTDDIDFLITELGNAYGQRTTSRQRGYRQDARSQQKANASVQKLRTVASLVARSFQTGDAKSAQALFALGVDQLSNKDFAGARRSFHNVVLANPADWSGRYYYARALLETGDPELARGELTYVLCWMRFLPEAFVVRSMCAAKQNDLKRAKADLDTAKKLDPAGAADAESAVAQAQQQSPPAGAEKDAAAWDRLLASAKDKRPFDDLVTAALELRRSVDARRLRCDEVYQDRLHELSSAARAQPGNADRLADMAEYLRDNNEVLSLRVAPNGGVHFLRQQTKESSDAEIGLAFALTDEGLAADPQHARSWAVRSTILLHNYNKLQEAEQAANSAIRFDARLTAGHMALSDCYKAYAARLRQKAIALRTPKTGTRRVRVLNQNGGFIRYDSELYLIPPSPAELAQAAECDREAAEYEHKEQDCLNTALACAKGTKEEPFYQALMLYLKSDFAGALPFLQKAVSENPTDPKLTHSLANCLHQLGRDDESMEQYARAVNLRETTAEVWLSVAWNRIERTSWKSAREALLRARETDPTDARTAAYWGIVAESDTTGGADPDAGLQAALAQEEARARANQTSFLASAKPATKLSPEEVGLSIMLRLKAAKSIFQTNPEQAAEYYLTNVAAEPRLSEWNLAKVVFSAMLPSPNRDAKHPADPPPLVSVLKNNRVYAGQALLSAGQAERAAKQFAAAENFANRLPAGGTAYLEFELEPQYVPFRVSSMPIYVKLLNAQSLLQQGQRDRARMELQQVRYYLANRTQDQRAMQDDPIPGLFERLAPSVGLR